MPYKSKNTNSSENMGDPTAEGNAKAGIKPVGEAMESPDRHDELKAKYTEGEDEPAQDLVRHKNRNYNKPDINKPSYS